MFCLLTIRCRQMMGIVIKKQKTNQDKKQPNDSKHQNRYPPFTKLCGNKAPDTLKDFYVLTEPFGLFISFWGSSEDLSSQWAIPQTMIQSMFGVRVPTRQSHCQSVSDCLALLFRKPISLDMWIYIIYSSINLSIYSIVIC